MKLSNILNNAYRRCGLSGTLIFTLIVLASSPALGMTQVGLYDVWETQVTNSKSYSNPFDFNVIELRATFTSPSGSKISFFGFYDGNGNGGQTGNVWKLRFMPDKVGTWNYTYSWTDGTSGGSGSFKVVDTGLPGPLKVATDNPWYFMDSRGKPFDWRGYDITAVRHWGFVPMTSNIQPFKDVVNSKMVGKYNITMAHGPGYTQWAKDSGNTEDQWWPYNSTFDFKRYNLRVWKAWDEFMRFLASKKINTFMFSIMSQNSAQSLGTDGMKSFYRYFTARNGAYWHLFGWSPTWEWTDIWKDSDVNQIMQQVQAWDPFQRLLTIHDCSNSNFTDWLDFSMRQASATNRTVRSVFDANSRTAGQQQGGCDSQGGVGTAFLDKPIIGSEDIWENPSGKTSGPRNGTEVRRAAWGILMAGVLPLYSEWNSGWAEGTGEGEPEVRRMFDFFYSKTQYRQYKQLNQLVSSSARQVASGHRWASNTWFMMKMVGRSPLTCQVLLRLTLSQFSGMTPKQVPRSLVVQ